jgi:hypothetical protein
MMVRAIECHEGLTLASRRVHHLFLLSAPSKGEYQPPSPYLSHVTVAITGPIFMMA